MNGPARLLTEREAADILGVSPESVRHWRYQGMIGFVRIGRKPMFRPEHLEKFIHGNEVAPLKIASRR